MIVCPDYDKFEFTKTDLELVDAYGAQISSVDVDFCEIVEHLQDMVETVVHLMPCTMLRHRYAAAIFEVVKACYKLDKVLMNEEVPSWYEKETHAESASFVNRSEVTETLKDQLKDDLWQFMGEDLYNEIENDQNVRKLKNESKS